MKYSLSILFATAIACMPLMSKAESFSANHDAIQKLFKSSEEKTTKDALWTSRNIFKVGVLDNGSNRDGYADYVCQVMYDYGFKGQSIWVQVIDISKLVKTDKWVKLGEAHCD